MEEDIIKPWLKECRTDIQDNPEYWNSAEILLNDNAMATVEQAEKNPMHGWGDWAPTGMMDTIERFCVDFRVSGGSNILEVGCGGGKQVMAWREFNMVHGRYLGSIVGIDHALGAVQVAKARMPDLDFRCIKADDWDTLYTAFGLNCFDVIYTLVCLQHNSAHKLKLIFDNIHGLLSDDGLLWLINEGTIDSENYVGIHQPQVIMTPWVTDERGSHGTAAWWIGFIADHWFELLKYEKSSYVFKKIKRSGGWDNG